MCAWIVAIGLTNCSRSRGTHVDDGGTHVGDSGTARGDDGGGAPPPDAGNGCPAGMARVNLAAADGSSASADGGTSGGSGASGGGASAGGSGSGAGATGGGAASPGGLDSGSSAGTNSGATGGGGATGSGRPSGNAGASAGGSGSGGGANGGAAGGGGTGASVNAVCVDRFEAATEVIDATGAVTAHPYDQPVDAVAKGSTIVAVVADGVKPQGYISETQAAAACAAANKRLCTLSEWLAACQGPQGWTYPYGNTYEAGACNEGRATNPVNDCFGSGDVFTSANMNSSCCDDQPNTVAPGGSFPRCVSSWGIYDLHGNLHEWIDATSSAGDGIFKGGYFVDAKINGPGCLYTTTAHAKTYHDYSTGFRCCADPQR